MSEILLRDKNPATSEVTTPPPMQTPQSSLLFGGSRLACKTPLKLPTPLWIQCAIHGHGAWGSPKIKTEQNWRWGRLKGRRDPASARRIPLGLCLRSLVPAACNPCGHRRGLCGDGEGKLRSINPLRVSAPGAPGRRIRRVPCPLPARGCCPHCVQRCGGGRLGLLASKSPLFLLLPLESCSAGWRAGRPRERERQEPLGLECPGCCC